MINGWHNPLLMRMAEPFIGLARLFSGRSAKKKKNWSGEEDQAGTFVEKMTPRWLKNELNGELKYQDLPVAQLESTVYALVCSSAVWRQSITCDWCTGSKNTSRVSSARMGNIR